MEATEFGYAVDSILPDPGQEPPESISELGFRDVGMKNEGV